MRRYLFHTNDFVNTMASVATMLTPYDLDKRFPSIAMSSPLYGASYATTTQSSALFAFSDSENMWAGSKHVPPCKVLTGD